MLIKLQSILFFALIFLLPTQLAIHFWPDSALIFGIRVDYLSPTVYLTDLMVIGLLVISLWNGKIKIFSPLILCSMFYVLCSMFYSLNQPAAFYKLLKLLEFGYFAFFIATHKELINEKFYKILSASLIFISIFGVLQFLKQGSVGGLFWFFGERTFSATEPGIALFTFQGQEFLRPYSIFSHPNSFAGYVLVTMILLYPFSNILKKTAGILGAIVLVISFSQSAWLTCFYIVFFAKVKLTKQVLIVLTFLLVLIFSTLPLWLGKFFSANEIILRKDLLQIGFEMFKTHPLFGVGLNNFVPNLPQFAQVSGIWFLQPVHNIYLLLLTEVGLVGVFLFCFLFKRCVKLANKTILLVVIAIAITGSLDHYWLTLQQNQLLLFLVFGLSWVYKSPNSG